MATEKDLEQPDYHHSCLLLLIPYSECDLSLSVL